MMIKVSLARYEATKALLPVEDRTFSNIFDRMSHPQGLHLHEVYFWPEKIPRGGFYSKPGNSTPRGIVRRHRAVNRCQGCGDERYYIDG